jgi:hypothetical protein
MINLEMWGSFAFFNKDYHEMTEQDLEDNRELIRILEEDYLHYKFAPGYCESKLLFFSKESSNA